VFVVGAIFVALLIGSVAAFGFGNGFGKNLSDEEKIQMKTFRDNVQTAVENNDYAEWKSLMESQLTEENFQKLVDRQSKISEAKDLMKQIKTAMENGDTEKAEDLREQMHELMPEKAKAYGIGYGKMKHGFGSTEDED
ncbi:MAG: hypothetical protein AABW51_05355, partial [Nanoarchaeota archaeon]